ncbi:MAG TPA: SDR family NAD(P)-dependent oxidoreductase [Stenotrophomonas sp.]|nr:SDR family NAD(P)-dependent oxidoreductase [Stenotrophomonas sp.]
MSLQAEVPLPALPTRNWLVTGASSGIGLALAEYLLERGQRVVLAARTTPEMTELAKRYPQSALAMELDVTDARQRLALVAGALARFGHVDVLVNNAAIDFLGAVEEQREADYRAQFEVNFFGAVEMIRLVLPGMRARRSGTIINVSSMDGIASLPANGFYSASKFALEGLTEALWQEVEPLGLRALLVEPGSVRTGIERRTHFSGEPLADYASTSGAFRKLVASVTPDMFPGDPVRVAAAIFNEAMFPSGRHWVVLGSDALRRIRGKLDAFCKDLDSSARTAAQTDYPGSAQAVL